ncbi:hypothetical protein HK102_009244, partial [Quaeritorhiza haematococci]
WVASNWPECFTCFYGRTGEFECPFDSCAYIGWQHLRLPGSSKLNKNSVLVPVSTSFVKLELKKSVFLEHLVCWGPGKLVGQVVDPLDRAEELRVHDLLSRRKIQSAFGSKKQLDNIVVCNGGDGEEGEGEEGEGGEEGDDGGEVPDLDGTVAGYLNCIYNKGGGQPWDVYFRILAAVHHETRGSAEGLAVFNAWSEQSDKHDLQGNRNNWEYMSTRHVEKPVTIGSLRFIAQRCCPAAFEKPALDKMKFIDQYFDYSHLKGFFDTVDEINQRRVEVCHSPVGTGKTTKAIELIRSMQFKSVVIPTPRRSLAQELTAKLNAGLKGTGIEFKLYLNVKPGRMPDQKFLVIQMESLRKLIKFDKSIATFDLVLVDEIESVLRTFNSPTMTGNWTDSESARMSLSHDNKERLPSASDVFEHLVRSARKVVVMDAFILPKTIVALKDLLGDQPGLRRLVVNRYKHEDIRTVDIPDFEVFKGQMIDLVDSGRKFAVFTTSKGIGDDIKAFLKQHNRDLRIQFYNSSMPGKSTRELQEVNESWVNYDVVIYTPTITVGVSFDVPDYFYTIFVYAGMKSCTVRDMIQACFRIRHLESKTIYYHINTGRAPPKHRSLTLEGTKAFVKQLLVIEGGGDWQNTPCWLQNVCYFNILEENLSQ